MILWTLKDLSSQLMLSWQQPSPRRAAHLPRMCHSSTFGTAPSAQLGHLLTRGEGRSVSVLVQTLAGQDISKI